MFKVAGSEGGSSYNIGITVATLPSYKENEMEQVVQFSEREEVKALPVLLRHSPGVALPDRVYVLSQEAVQALHDAGVHFRELSRTGLAPAGQGATSGERI